MRKRLIPAPSESVVRDKPSSDSSPPTGVTKSLVDTFIRQQFVGKVIQLSVRKVLWRGSHSPESEWVSVTTLPADVSPEAIQDAIDTILLDDRFFSECQECRRRQPVGWMHSDSLCQSCAERNHGVVY